MLSKYLPKTDQEFIKCFRVLAALTEAALDHIDTHVFISDYDRIDTLNKASKLVESLSTMRGDNSLLDSAKPTEFSREYFQEMYSTEQQPRKRLIKLGYTHPKF